MKKLGFQLFFLAAVLVTLPVTASDIRQRLERHVRILGSDSLEGRGLGTAGAERARNYIIDQFADAGISPLDSSYIQSFSFREKLALISANNIVGVVRGSDPLLKDEYILIGAHYDHLGYELSDGESRIFPGADDNASGVGTIIELGRYFAENQDKLRRSLLIVAFDAEESGLLGSKHFAAFPLVEISAVKMMFSLDMVGMLKANDGLGLKGIGGVLDGAELAQSVSEEIGIRLKNLSSSIEQRTDTAPFGQKGIPSVHVFTGLKSPYHKPEDTWDLLDYDGMYTVFVFMQQLLTELSAKETLEPIPAIVKSSDVHQKNRNHSLIKVGLTLHAGKNFHLYDDEFYRADGLFSGSAGLFIQLPVAKMITIHQQVLLDFNSSKIEGGNFRRQSIAFPLSLQVGTPGGRNQPFRAFVFAGGYYRYNFSGKIGDSAMDFNLFGREEWGITAGLGIQIMKITVGYTNRSALTSLGKNQYKETFDRGNYFTISYFL